MHELLKYFPEIHLMFLMFVVVVIVSILKWIFVWIFFELTFIFKILLNIYGTAVKKNVRYKIKKEYNAVVKKQWSQKIQENENFCWKSGFLFQVSIIKFSKHNTNNFLSYQLHEDELVHWLLVRLKLDIHTIPHHVPFIETNSGNKIKPLSVIQF